MLTLTLGITLDLAITLTLAILHTCEHSIIHLACREATATTGGVNQILRKRESKNSPDDPKEAKWDRRVGKPNRRDSPLARKRAPRTLFRPCRSRTHSRDRGDSVDATITVKINFAREPETIITKSVRGVHGVHVD